MRLVAPEDVTAGTTFTAYVDSAEGEKVEWEVEHGTVVRTSASGDQVEIMTGSSGPLRLSAKVARKSGCFAHGEATVYILQPLAQCTTPPKAILESVSRDCRRATVRATFTGTGPFAGEWSDGTPFRTSGQQGGHFLDTVGPGVVPITLKWTDCAGSHSQVINLTIVP